MKLKITVHGVAYEVEVEMLDAGEGFPTHGANPLPAVNGGPALHAAPPAPTAAPTYAPAAAPTPSSSGSGNVVSPLAGVILELKCKVGDRVTAGQTVLVLEAMKMETNIAAGADATVTAIPIAVGDSVREGQTLIELG